MLWHYSIDDRVVRKSSLGSRGVVGIRWPEDKVGAVISVKVEAVDREGRITATSGTIEVDHEAHYREVACGYRCHDHVGSVGGDPSGLCVRNCGRSGHQLLDAVGSLPFRHTPTATTISIRTTVHEDYEYNVPYYQLTYVWTLTYHHQITDSDAEAGKLRKRTGRRRLQLLIGAPDSML